MRRINVKEPIHHRYLGALRMVDRVSGRALRRPFRIKAPGLTLFFNRSFLAVISHATGLGHHLAAFAAPPASPPPDTLAFDVLVEDGSGQFLSRRATLRLPRAAAPEADNSLFTPFEIPLYPAPAAHVSPNWSVLRVSIYDLADVAAEKPVPGALVRLVDGDGRLRMSGLSDQRGEAAVLVPGIPITTFAAGTAAGEDADDDAADVWAAGGAVTETETPVHLEVIVGPGAAWPVDPDAIEDQRAEWRRPFRTADSEQLRDGLPLALQTGRSRSVKLFVNLTASE
ncbi:hypothetical protein [Desulfatitalea alkaliphila]|uniref:Uncharacterized protein n=1 Tax=Desulfatitalea alkaliphila TaxID=2929485 RepID=A0AA41UP38_9BACT|nr:hypothetical protein [Desulfatitalea alkaliphila]MCJ8500113.1 hypothetical protein [Desulfatitalea alkaliphila]